MKRNLSSKIPFHFGKCLFRRKNFATAAVFGQIDAAQLQGWKKNLVRLWCHRKRLKGRRKRINKRNSSSHNDFKIKTLKEGVKRYNMDKYLVRPNAIYSIVHLSLLTRSLSQKDMSIDKFQIGISSRENSIFFLSTKWYEPFIHFRRSLQLPWSK